MSTNDAAGDSPRGDGPDRKGWLIALAVSLALHLGAILGLGHLALGQSTASTDVMPIQLVLTEPSDPHSNEPSKEFTELPADRADAAPAKPDRLSNVTSRAR